MDKPVKLITMDGPSGVGKGTASRIIAHRLGWRYMDSGVLYRIVAHEAIERGVALDDVSRLVDLAKDVDVDFEVDAQGDDAQIHSQGRVINDLIRTESCGNSASIISKIPEIRAALLQRQRDFLTEDGLVTDGRDMGTVVFPDAPLKFFMVADLDERVRRRQNQLQSMDIHVNIADLRRDLAARDERDRTRSASPLKPAEDAEIIDTSHIRIKAVCDQLMERIRQVFPGALSD